MSPEHASNANSIHAQRLNTHASRNTAKSCVSLIHPSASLICVWPRAILTKGGGNRDMAGGLFLEQTDMLQAHVTAQHMLDMIYSHIIIISE